MKRHLLPIPLLLASAAAAAQPSPPPPRQALTLEALAARVEELERALAAREAARSSTSEENETLKQRVAVLERQVELQQEDAATAKASAPVISANDKGNPPGKLADAELHFTEGPLEGLKLIGFAIWERRAGGGRNVTFPARQYSVHGERRSFALLRPVTDSASQDRIRGLVLKAYTAEEEAAMAS